MRDSVLGSLPLVGSSGYIVMAAIVVLVLVALLVTAYIRGRYALLSGDVRRNVGQLPPQFRSETLSHIAREVQQAAAQHGGDINTQAIIAHNLQSDLGIQLTAERLVKADPSLPIIQAQQ